jgi:transcription initiation factor TFIIIB Brf1 subunit/transcription initiation factor TFIIB
MGSAQEDGDFDFHQFSIEMAALREEVKLSRKDPGNGDELIDLANVVALQNKMNSLFAELIARLRNQESQLEKQKEQIQDLSEDRNLFHILTSHIEVGTLKLELNQKIIDRQSQLISKLLDHGSIR